MREVLAQHPGSLELACCPTMIWGFSRVSGDILLAPGREPGVTQRGEVKCRQARQICRASGTCYSRYSRPPADAGG